MIDHPEARAIFAEYDITVVPANAIVGPGQTRAVATLDRIRRRYGAERARFVVMTLAETSNNKAAIDKWTLWAVNDMVTATNRVFPALIENRVSDWLDFFDSIPVGYLARWCHDVNGIVPLRYALFGMIWERMERAFGDLAQQPDLLDDRGVAA